MPTPQEKLADLKSEVATLRGHIDHVKESLKKDDLIVEAARTVGIINGGMNGEQHFKTLLGKIQQLESEAPALKGETDALQAEVTGLLDRYKPLRDETLRKRAVHAAITPAATASTTSGSAKPAKPATSKNSLGWGAWLGIAAVLAFVVFVAIFGPHLWNDGGGSGGVATDNSAPAGKDPGAVADRLDRDLKALNKPLQESITKVRTEQQQASVERQQMRGDIQSLQMAQNQLKDRVDKIPSAAAPFDWDKFFQRLESHIDKK